MSYYDTVEAGAVLTIVRVEKAKEKNLWRLSKIDIERVEKILELAKKKERGEWDENQGEMLCNGRSGFLILTLFYGRKDLPNMVVRSRLFFFLVAKMTPKKYKKFWKKSDVFCRNFFWKNSDIFVKNFQPKLVRFWSKNSWFYKILAKLGWLLP